MSKTVIRVRNLGKKYRLGATLSPDTLRDHIMSTAGRLFRRPPLLAPGSPLPAPRSPDFWALKDVSFDVKEGEVLGVIGPNGSGKSTLLKILTGITEPTEGEVRMKGRVGSLLEVGTGFHQELTGRENIYMNGAILGMTRAEINAKFEEIVVFSGVEKFLDTPVKRYSSGMRVRLGFAVAAHLEPEILLIDEVLAVGDMTFQKKCLGKMDEVAKGGRTVILVSHNVVAIESLCPNSVLLNGGMLITHGSTSDALRSYLSIIGNEQSENKDPVGELARPADSPGLIRRAVLLNSQQEKTGQIRIGEACEFHIQLESAEVIADAAIGLHVKSAESMQKVTSFRTKYQHNRGTDLSGRMTWQCRCPELMLVPGNYVVELTVTSSGRIVDHVNQGFSFSVIGADVFGTGRVPKQKDGVAISRGHWEIF